MCINDFVSEYRAPYICFFFDPKIWQCIDPIPVTLTQLLISDKLSKCLGQVGREISGWCPNE